MSQGFVLVADQMSLSFHSEIFLHKIEGSSGEGTAAISSSENETLE